MDRIQINVRGRSHAERSRLQFTGVQESGLSKARRSLRRRRRLGAGSSDPGRLCRAHLSGRPQPGRIRQSILFFHNLYIYTKDTFRIEDQLIDGEKVVTRMTARVRSRETGEPVTLVGINIARIVDGKIVEEWNTWEQLTVPQR